MSENGRKDALYELLHAAYLVLMAETLAEIKAQFIHGMAAFEEKELKINLGKTKIMESDNGSWVVVLTKIDLYGVFGKTAKVNCVKYKTCKKWVHAWCVRVKRVSCKMNKNFEFRLCMNGSNEACDNVSNSCSSELEKMNNFCCLDGNRNGEEGSELAFTQMVGLGWQTFNSMSSTLCVKKHTWTTKKQHYRTCVRSFMTDGSETCVVRSVERVILRRAEKRMLRKMCGLRLADGVNTTELMVRLG